VTIVEPPARGERRATLNGPGTTPFLELAWRAPSIHDANTAATILVDVVLGGETGLFAAGSGWGHSGEHPSARLYRRLVDPGLAAESLSDGDKPLAKLGPTPTELADARTKVARGADLAYEGASKAGFRLGYFAMLGPAPFEGQLLRKILKTTAPEIRDQARRLFDPDERVVVRYSPNSEAPGE
ncbi:MAG: hypothetical protein L3J86_06180, partial [Thermoplasmata archaeon]|nr:hypothetical protein [Thermoplasmata archaeon]